MKKNLHYLIFLALIFFSFHNKTYAAPLTGTKTVGGSSPNYLTLSLAIDDLNTNGTSTGGVTFLVAAGHTETLLNKIITTTTGSAISPIVFMKSGIGANPLITGGVGTSTTVDGIIKIAGTDYITIDGINLLDPTTNTTTTTQMEWGYAIVKASATDGSQHITIKNCTVTLQKTNVTTKGIYSGNHIATATTVLTLTAFSGTNSYIDIYSNTINNCFSAIYFLGYNNTNYYDDSIRIGTFGQNIITDFGGSSTAYGIYMQYFKNVDISNDSIYQNITPTATSTHYGIYTGNSTDANAKIINNFIQLTINGTQTTRAVYGIYCLNGLAVNSILIDNNRIQNCLYSSTTTLLPMIYTSSIADINISNNTISRNVRTGTSGQTSYIYSALTPLVRNINNNFIFGNNCSGTSSKHWGIYLAAGTANIYQNTISYDSSSGTSSVHYDIYCATGGENIYQNTLSGNYGAGTSSDAYGIYIVAAGITPTNIYSNYFSLNTFQGTSTGTLYNIYLANGNANIYKNEIATSSSLGNTLVGIELAGAANAEYNVYQNKIHSFSSTNASCIVSGIDQSALSTANIHNNLIGGLTTGSSTSATNGINAINISSATDGTISNIYHNNIYLAATSTGGTNGILLNTSSLVSLANNIIVNVSANGTTVARAASAIKRTSTNFSTYSAFSNNNFLYVGAVSTANRFVFYDGTNSSQTLSLFQTFAANREQTSITGSVNFLSTIGSSPNFLKPDTTIPSLLESSGRIILGINGDHISATSRAAYPILGQINGGGNLPDIGAFELDMISSDSSGPEIIYPLLTRSLITTSKDLTNVQINDPRGVNTTFGHLPRLYFKKSTNANSLASSNTSASDGWKYVESFSTGSPYTFTIDYTLLYSTGLVASGDAIQYFVVAEDNSSIHNARVKGAILATNAASVSLTSANFPASSPNSYGISASGLPFTITVGATGADYPNLTMTGGLFEAINNGLITNDVTVQIKSDLLGETGAIALNKFAEDGFGIGTYKITIVPFLPTNYNIEGAITTGGLIRLVDVSRVIIDGNYFGSGNYLTFINHVVSGSNAVIHFVSSGFNGGCNNASIRNCNLYTDTSYVNGGTGIYIGGTSISTGTGLSQGYDNKYITIVNNFINRTYNAIMVNGIVPNYADSINILNNMIGSDSASRYIGACGIYVRGANRMTISGNTIYNIINANTYELDGINLQQDVYNVNVNANNINNIMNTAIGSSAVFGIYVRGAASSNILFKNNIISKIVGQGAASDITAGPVGIYFNSGSNYKVLNNAITLSGNRLNTAVGSAYTACVYLKSSVTVVNVSNNIFKNVMTSSNSVNVGSNFCLFSSDNNATAFTRLNNNIYYANSTTSGMTNALGYIGSAIRTDLLAWKSFTVLDKNSLWGEPGYMADSVVQPNLNDSNIWYLNGRGFPTVDVSTDYFGNPRSTSVTTGASDIGAYEVTPSVTPRNANASAIPAAGTTTYYLVAMDTVAAISWASFSTVPSSIGVRFFSGTNPPTPTSPKYINTYWDIQATPNTGLFYNIKLYYKPEALRTVNNESSLVMAQRDGTNPWVPYLLGTTVVDSILKTMTVSNLSSLSRFTGTDVSNPLPIKMLNFEGFTVKNDVQLLWSTGNEINNAGFEIQRSIDGNKFEKINFVKGNGNTNSINNYELIDHLDLNLQTQNMIFYRLKQIDFDGKFEYSKVISISKNQTDLSTIIVHPNPFVNAVSLSFISENSGKGVVELSDITGRKMLINEIEVTKGENSFEWKNVSSLQNGIYFINVNVNGKTSIHKVIKAN